jgi:hypothetical protein
MRAPAMTPVLNQEEELCLLLARGGLTPEERARALQLLASLPQWPLVMGARTQSPGVSADVSQPARARFHRRT